MIDPTVILDTLRSLPVHATDRGDSAEERTQLLRPYATAIADAAHTAEEAALLIAVGYHESTFDRRVIEGRCADISLSACDNGRARGVFQLHLAACRTAYALPVNTPASVRAEAKCAIGLLRFGAARCRNRAVTSVHGGLSIYAGVRSCDWSGANDRVVTMRSVLAGWRKAS